MAITMGLAKAKDNFSHVMATVNRTGRLVTVMRSNKPWVTINPAATLSGVDCDAVDVVIGFMEEYADVFEERAKMTRFIEPVNKETDSRFTRQR